MRKLADVMTEKTWFQIGKLKSEDLPGVCLAVALAEVPERETEYLTAGVRAVRIILRLWPERVELPDRTYWDGNKGMMNMIARFNDHKETTWQDIEKFIAEFDSETEATL